MADPSTGSGSRLTAQWRSGVLAVWRWTHLAGAALAPWVVWIAYYNAPATDTAVAEGSQAAHYAYAGAVCSAILLVSTMLLRLNGPSPAATWPFAALWTLGIAMWVYLAVDAEGSCRGTDGLCLPGFGVFFLGLIAAVVVDIVVACSLLINGVTDRANG